jgi:hypothetical protein
MLAFDKDRANLEVEDSPLEGTLASGSHNNKCWLKLINLEMALVLVNRIG